MTAVRLRDPHVPAGTVSPTQAAKILHCHPKTVRRYIRDGLLKADSISTGSPFARRYFIERRSLAAFIRKHRNDS